MDNKQNQLPGGLEALAALASAAPTANSDPQGRGMNEAPYSGEKMDSNGIGQNQTEATNVSSVTASQQGATALPGLTSNSLQQQQQQQLIQQQYNMGAVAASAGQQQQFNPAGLQGQAQGNSPQLAILQQLQQRNTDPSVALALQNMAFYQLMMQNQAPTQSQSQLTNTSSQMGHLAALLGLSQNGNVNTGVPNQALHAATPNNEPSKTHSNHSQHQNSNMYGNSNSSIASAPTPAQPSMSMHTPKSPSVTSAPPLVAAPVAQTSRAHVSSNPAPKRAVQSEDDESDSHHYENGDKKEQKRAANRRSAQLSRKRKKQFIEELKDENDDLRRKEQILRSIPDLVVVFDSTGKLWFVSQSISRFIQFNADDLEGKSFWDRLCPESVRLLKAAFMDSLAARGDNHSDTVPLGGALWDLRLCDKDGSFVTVTLNGVVHFAGERPECVCCIRPKHGVSLRGEGRQVGEEVPVEASRSAKGQAMVSDSSTAVRSGDGAADAVAKAAKQQPRVGNVGAASAIRISDSGNSSGSGESESGSSDELGARA